MKARLPGDRRRMLFAAALGFAMTMMMIAHAPPASADEDATALVTQVGTQGIAAIQPNVAVPQRIAVLGKLFQENFDVRGIRTFALGRYRRLATAHERQEYYKLFNEFAARVVSHQLSDYAGASFRITGSQAAGPGQIIVNSQLSRAGGDPLELQWFLQRKHGRYMVSDLKVGEVSMRVALRDHFATWIENNGNRFDALLAVMRQMNPQIQ